MAPARTTTVTIADVKARIARRLSEYRVSPGPGEVGVLTFSVQRAVTRTFRAHWTGFKLIFPGATVVLRADVGGGRLWAEGYISTSQPSWVLAFRKEPPKVRGSGGPRPDDKLSSAESIEVALAHRKRLIEAGVIPNEELIRMEDLDDPLEAVDSFFNYTEWYVLHALDADWHQMGYHADPSIGWGPEDEAAASLPIDAAVEEGLKKSDIIWLVTSPQRPPIPCWFVYKDGKVYVLSGEPQQVIPDARNLREVHVVTRWKGRDARMAEFDAGVRVITGDDPEFEQIAGLLMAKRQSMRGSHDEILDRWRRDCVILELTRRS
ncbi:MAG TPA: hypothetical protein VII47_12495, partial [Actinomycetota bacterium]|jgi:hypothetical protein